MIEIGQNLKELLGIMACGYGLILLYIFMVGNDTGRKGNKKNLEKNKRFNGF